MDREFRAFKVVKGSDTVIDVADEEPFHLTCVSFADPNGRAKGRAVLKVCTAAQSEARRAGDTSATTLATLDVGNRPSFPLNVVLCRGDALRGEFLAKDFFTCGDLTLHAVGHVLRRRAVAVAPAPAAVGKASGSGSGSGSGEMLLLDSDAEEAFEEARAAGRGATTGEKTSD